MRHVTARTLLTIGSIMVTALFLVCWFFMRLVYVVGVSIDGILSLGLLAIIGFCLIGLGYYLLRTSRRNSN